MRWRVFAAIALLVGLEGCGDSGSGGSANGGTNGGTSNGGTGNGGPGKGGTNSGGTSSGGTNSGGTSSGGSAGASDGGSCLTDSVLLASVPPGGGSECSFTFQGNYTPGFINLVLTPGWGTVCFAGGSSGCGSGSSADGWWWLSGNEIALCDATCSRFYDQPAGKLTIELGCPSEACNHGP